MPADQLHSSRRYRSGILSEIVASCDTGLDDRDHSTSHDQHESTRLTGTLHYPYDVRDVLLVHHYSDTLWWI